MENAKHGIVSIECADGGRVYVTLGADAPSTSIGVRRAALRAWNKHNGSRGGRAVFWDAVCSAHGAVCEYRIEAGS